MMSGEIMKIESKTQFDEAVAGGVVLADFWAPWCGPCRAQLPILEDIAKKYANRIAVIKVNIDDNTELATAWKVEAVPTLFLFKDGTMLKRFTGAQKGETLTTYIDRFLE